MLEGLARQFADRLNHHLNQVGLAQAVNGAPGEAHWTPRRLIFTHEAVLEAEPRREEEILGPPVRVAVGADGGFTPQALGFAAKNAMPPEALMRVTTPKGDYVALRRPSGGRAAAELLASIIPQAFLEVEPPRAMRWTAGVEGGGLRFIRPVRWLLALWGAEVIPFTLGSLTAGRVSWGHRALSHGAHGSFEAASTAAFPALWAEHHVIASAAARQQRILTAAGRVLPQGLRLRADAGLLSTLVNLTEFPEAVLGSFDPADLTTLPPEVLVTVMRDHQKYFAVEDAAGALQPYFVAIINLDGDPRGYIRHGHERVLRARFSDARFFWEQDRKLTLVQRLPLLDQVTFQAKLGSYREKSRRMRALAGWLAGQWQPDHECEAPVAETAAELAKCDLTTEMVKEFTELQGIMGGNYARAEGLGPAIAAAIADQYLWETAPRTAVGAAVGLADKLDTIAGMFAIGEVPTGSADPFSLRRQANAVIRTLIERRLELNLKTAVDQALAGLGDLASFRLIEDVRRELAAFFLERLAFYLRESGGYAPAIVQAVLAGDGGHGGDDPLQAALRCQAVAAAPEVAAVAAVVKRARNIVRKEKWTAVKVNPDLVAAPAEQALLYAVEGIPTDSGYAAELAAIGELAQPLERFFNEIRVNDDDPALRANRLSLLAATVARLSRIADFSELSS